MATPQSARPLRSVRRPKRVPSPLYDANAPAPISLTAIHKKEAPADQVDQQMHAPMPPMLARKSCSFSDDVLPTPAPLPEPSHDARESVPSGPLPIKDPLDSLRAWTREDVQSWLSGSEIEQENLAKAAFDDHIDGAVLAEMGPDAWAELGVLSAIQRCKLIAAVKKAAASGERPQRTIIRRSTSSDSLRGSDKIPEFEVLCRCTIQKLQIESLDKGAKGVFTAYVKFEASWRDNCKAIRELATGGKKLCDDMIDKNESGPSKLRLKQQRSGVEEPFTPRIQFMNCIAKEDERSFYSIKGWTEKDPVVRYCTFFTGTFNLRNMDLRLFPIDEQMLTIEVQSGWERPESVAPSAGEGASLSGRDSNGGRKSSLRTLAAQRSTAYLKNVTLKRAEGDKKHSALSVNTISFAVKNQYRLTHALFFDEKTSHPRDSSENFEYSQLLISMHVRRRSWYYLHNIIAPSFIITSSLLATYGLDRHDATRLEVSITVLLALTAFKFVLVEKVPDVDYATIIDWYVLSSFIFVFAVICLQFFTFLGVYEERPYNVTVGMPAWWPDNWLPEGDASRAPTVIDVPPPLPWSAGIWMAYHLLILIVFAALYTWRQCFSPKSRRVRGKKYGEHGVTTMTETGVVDDYRESRKHLVTPDATPPSSPDAPRSVRA